MPPPVVRLLAAAPPRARGGRAGPGPRRGDGGRGRTCLRLRVRAAAGEAAPPPSRTQVSRALLQSVPRTPRPTVLLFVRDIVHCA